MVEMFDEKGKKEMGRILKKCIILFIKNDRFGMINVVYNRFAPVMVTKLETTLGN